MAPQPRKADDISKASAAKESKGKGGSGTGAGGKGSLASASATNSGKNSHTTVMPQAQGQNLNQGQNQSQNLPQNSEPVFDFNPLVPPPFSKGIDDILEAARRNLHRLDPKFAFYILSAPQTQTPTTSPAVLVDIRPAAQRQEEGVIPGAMVIERNVLEWRFDPRSSARLDIANRYDLRVIVFCSEGYTSSLAAHALQQLGLWNATDIEGGFKAWKSMGLPHTLAEAVGN